MQPGRRQHDIQASALGHGYSARSHDDAAYVLQVMRGVGVRQAWAQELQAARGPQGFIKWLCG